MFGSPNKSRREVATEAIWNDVIIMNNGSQDLDRKCVIGSANSDEEKLGGVVVDKVDACSEVQLLETSPSLTETDCSVRANASEKLFEVQISKKMLFGAEPDITFARYKRHGCREDTKGFAQIASVSCKFQYGGLKPGMFLIMVGNKNVTLSDYDEQLKLIHKHVDSSNTQYYKLTFCEASPFHYWLPKTPHNVGVKVEIRSITAIDTVNQNFNCRFLLKFVWQPSRQEIVNYAKTRKWDVRNWRPGFEFPNVQEFKCREQRQLCMFDENVRTRSERGSEKYVFMNNGEVNPKGFKDLLNVDSVFMGCIEVNASFAERLELEKFPFDTQDLTISLWSDTRSNEMQLIPYGNFFEQKMDFVTLSTSYCSVANEWDIREPIVDIETNIFFSSVQIRNKVSRHPNVFFWRMMVPMSLITTAALFSFFLDLSVGGERISYAFTAVLTSVVFQMKVYGDLPNITYMTLLDWYILYLFLFMLGIVLDTGIFTVLFNKCEDEEEENYIREIDAIMAKVFGFGFVVFHFWCYYVARFAQAKEAMKLTMNIGDKIPWKKVKSLLAIQCDNESRWIETYTTKKN